MSSPSSSSGASPSASTPPAGGGDGGGTGGATRLRSSPIDFSAARREGTPVSSTSSRGGRSPSSSSFHSHTSRGSFGTSPSTRGEALASSSPKAFFAKIKYSNLYEASEIDVGYLKVSFFLLLSIVNLLSFFEALLELILNLFFLILRTRRARSAGAAWTLGANAC